VGCPPPANEIGVVVKDGIVTLTGWVDNYAKKRVAERIAHRVRGVKAVANDIEVRLPSSAVRTDADIAAAATNALAWDAFVPIENLEVTVSKGWVTLRGEVEWGYERRAAERVVRRLAGVRGVTNLKASLDPVVDVPGAWSLSGACQSRASMRTHRVSRSAVCGYSSLSTRFLSKPSFIRRSACGSIHVVTNVARLSRGLPSSISSSCTTC
jgi:hypothetical protein